jgi:predicted alpha/beta superfamily hydrolase
MQDGQNLFDAFYSFAGEWEIDETLNKLFTENGQACIVIGIDNSGTYRIKEYSPWVNPTYGGGEGHLYARFLTETLKPKVDSLFRTLPDRENTGIMGSSLGALISFYTGLKYQHIFSKIGIFSPSFWFSPECYTFASQTPGTQGMKLYFLAGGQENGVSEHCIRMMDTLSKAGYPEDEMRLKTVPNGQHSEWFWRQEFRSAFEWLFPKPTGLDENSKSSGFIKPLFPNPTSGLVYIKSDYSSNDEISYSRAMLKSVSGTFNGQIPVQMSEGLLTMDLSGIPDGMYVLSLRFSGGTESRLVIKSKGLN